MDKDWKNIVRFGDIKDIEVKEDGTPIVQLDNGQFILRYKKMDMVPIMGNAMYARKSVAQKLESVNNELKKYNSNYRLLIAYAYRSLEIQKKYFNERLKEINQSENNLSEEEKIEKAHSMSAHPDVAGHPTGGAIDLTIWDEEKNCELDMGSGIAEFGEISYTYFPNLTDTQKKNRLLLNKIMTDAGFAPFLGEWWHFSYGDKEWAFFYKKPFAIYGPIETDDVLKK